MTSFEILQKFGSPVYIYEEGIVKERCSDIKEFSETLERGLPKGIKVICHYSTKANSNPAILSIVKKSGLSVDCMSPFELRVNELVGFTPDEMLYVCNNITADEMWLVHEKGLLICLDSVSQVKTWGELFPGTDIMVRINPGTTGVGHSEKVITSGKKTKFGISEENLPALLGIADKYNLNIVGTHQHLGSLFLNDKIPNYISGVKAGLDLVRKYFKSLKIVDLGGGFGIPYGLKEIPLHLPWVSDELLPVLRKFVKDYPTVEEFKFEPGRYIPCEAGVLLGTVTAVKHENNTYWICTDIGMNELVRPSMYGSYHKIHIIHQSKKNRPSILANFCGNICESGDILAENRWVTCPDVGDIVVVRDAGAYGYSMASNYTGRPRPAELLMSEDRTVSLIRERETVDDLLRGLKI